MKQLLLCLSALCIAGFVSGQTTYNFTGAVQTYTVPACVTSIIIDAHGAQGTPGLPGGTGGNGGNATGTLSVNPGDILYINVGGQNGYNGGGAAGSGGPTISGSGGGASDVRLNGTALTDRVIVAAGGGGGTGATQGSCSSGPAGNGGVGGGASGTSGTAGGGCGAGGNPGMGGTLVGGGSGGTGNSNCSATAGPGLAGILGSGGAGGAGIIGCAGFTGSGGGGGGGGYYGGGGGGGGAGGGGGSWAGGGGGGGSSYTGTLLAATTTPGTRAGDGMIVLTPNSGGIPPSPPTTAGPLTVCSGTSQTYTASTSGATSYTWSVPSGHTITGGQTTGTLSVTIGSSSGTFSVTATNACGTSMASTFVVNVTPTPVVNATANPSSVCMGSSSTLTATGATNYSWSTGGSTATVTVSPTSPATYTVTGTTNGCSATTTVSVNVNSSPSVIISAASTSICQGTTATLIASGAQSYSWSTGAVTSTVFVTPSVTTTYSVTGTIANGCSSSATITLTVNPPPVVTANASSGAVCPGNNVVLTASGASNYSWSSGGNSAIETVAPTVTTTFSVTGTDMNGCAGTATVAVTVHNAPEVILGPDLTVCGSTALNAGNPGSTYLWNNNLTTQIITVTSSGMYAVEVTNSDGCISSDTIIVTILSLPNVSGSSASDSVCTTDASVQLTGSPAGGTWIGAGVISGMFDPAIGAGMHSVTYVFTNSDGCTDSSTVSIFVGTCVGAGEFLNETFVSVFPNPNSGEFSLLVNGNGFVQFIISDATGRLVQQQQILPGVRQNIRMDAAGVYSLMVVASDGTSVTRRIIVME